MVNQVGVSHDKSNVEQLSRTPFGVLVRLLIVISAGRHSWAFSSENRHYGLVLFGEAGKFGKSSAPLTLDS